MKILIVVDMQNDFVSGPLGTKEAQSIVAKVYRKMKDREVDGYKIFCTFDSHDSNYLNTLEGQKLPVEHCIICTKGWELIPELTDIKINSITKKTFGFINWKEAFDGCCENEIIDEIELIGLCTDICVISNALILRAIYPNTKITVDASCCAGVTPEKHKAALEVMKSCQINIEGE